MKQLRLQLVSSDNTGRSVMAEAVVRSLLAGRPLLERLEVTSAGLLVLSPGGPPAPEAAAALRAIGLNADSHQASQFELDDIPDHDLVVFAEERHLDLIAGAGPPRGWREHCCLLREFDPVAVALGDLDLADPRVGGYQAYTRCLKQIRAAAPRLVRRLETLD